MKIVLALAIDALNEGNILESTRGDQDHWRALALNDGVGGYCSAVRDPLNLACCGSKSAFVNDSHEGVDRRTRRRRVLGHHYGALFAYGDEVSERAPGVDADLVQ
jgi:hypothetical protein